MINKKSKTRILMIFFNGLIGFVTLFISVTVVNAQNQEELYSKELEKVFNSLNKVQPLTMTMEYSEIYQDNKINFVDSCRYYKKGTFALTVFKNYETLLNSDYYIKADHENKELIIVRILEDNKSKFDKGQLLGQFDPDFLNKNNLHIQATSSDISNGKIFLKSEISPYYEGVELIYDTATHLPKTYTVFIKKGLSEKIKALTISFSNIQHTDFSDNILKEKNYFNLNKGKPDPVQKYQSYQIINL